MNDERRIKDRREADRYRKQRIRHCVKRLAHANLLFQEEIEELLDALGLTKEEVNDNRKGV